MRIHIREQLWFLCFSTSLLAVGILAAASWFQNHRVVLDLEAYQLSLTASLKAVQLAATFTLFEDLILSVSTRASLRSSLLQYNQGTNTSNSVALLRNNLLNAVSGEEGHALLLQAILYARNESVPTGNQGGFVQVTGTDAASSVTLPYLYDNGSQVLFGDPGLGYPPDLYPNLTYVSNPVNATYNTSTAFYLGRELEPGNPLVLGPWSTNATFSLLSFTVAVTNNGSVADEVLGWITIVMDARLIHGIVNAPEGLNRGGEILIIKPAGPLNRFSVDVQVVNRTLAGEQEVEFALPPQSNATLGLRHSSRQWGDGDPDKPFPMRLYPAVLDAFQDEDPDIDNAGSLITTANEQNITVSVGYALPSVTMVDWALVFEQSHAEVMSDIIQLRNILIACILGTVALVSILVFPIAHYSVRPLRRLVQATNESLEPDTAPSTDDGTTSVVSRMADGTTIEAKGSYRPSRGRRWGRFSRRLSGWMKKFSREAAERQESRRRLAFRVPRQVKDSKHFVHDEMTDLTRTFNEMSKELNLQYEELERRVRDRTAQLEMSKKAAEESREVAEAASKSKTLFIANISHELKTPLNGIIGMCSVSMQEEDLVQIRRAFQIIHRSGDLLLNLLTDLLTFSKNEIGNQLTLNEEDFRLRDIGSQIYSLFRTQARESQISLDLQYVEPQESLIGSSETKSYGPKGTAMVRDMMLWGDQYRILQILINLVSNSLKFTPAGGSVEIRIRCLGEKEEKRSKRNTNSWTSSIWPAPASSPHSPRILNFEFEVQDTGPGIPENQKEIIFEPFVQGDLGLSKKYSGTGLGLSICLQLARLMGGDVTLETKQGVGSTFRLHLPLRFVNDRLDSMGSTKNFPVTFPKSSPAFSGKDDATASLRSVSRSNGSLESSAVVPNPSLARSHAEPVLVESSHSITTLEPPPNDFPQPLQETTSKLPPTEVAKASTTTEAAIRSLSAEADTKLIPKVEDRPPVAKERLANPRVLVAEDNKVNQEVVMRMLKLEKISDITIAEDGQKAVDQVKASLAEQNPFDLIFMDIQMPNMDGIQSTRLIREAGFSAPIIALTAFSEESNVKECMEAGMNQFLPKPVRRPALKQVLTRFSASSAEGESR